MPYARPLPPPPLPHLARREEFGGVSSPSVPDRRRAGLALHEVLGAGQTSHADLRAGAARLLEAEHTLPTKADRLYLVLSEPPAEPWSTDSIHDVFTIDVIWRTPGGWEGNEAKTALGAS